MRIAILSYNVVPKYPSNTPKWIPPYSRSFTLCDFNEDAYIESR